MQPNGLDIAWRLSFWNANSTVPNRYTGREAPSSKSGNTKAPWLSQSHIGAFWSAHTSPRHSTMLSGAPPLNGMPRPRIAYNMAAFLTVVLTWQRTHCAVSWVWHNDIIALVPFSSWMWSLHITGFCVAWLLVPPAAMRNSHRWFLRWGCRLTSLRIFGKRLQRPVLFLPLVVPNGWRNMAPLSINTPGSSSKTPRPSLRPFGERAQETDSQICSST